MTSPALIDFSKASTEAANRLEALEKEAAVLYDKSILAWKHYVSFALDMYAGNLWRIKAATWEDYCHDYMPTEASTIRTYKSSLPIADLVETIAGEMIPESKLRQLGVKIRKVCKDASLIGETYQKVFELTGHSLPSEGEIQTTYENLARRKHEGIVQVNGVDVSLADALDDTIRYELYEMKQRQKAHIEASQQIASKRLDIAQKEALGAIFDYSSAKSSKALFDFFMGYKERKGL